MLLPRVSGTGDESCRVADGLMEVPAAGHSRESIERLTKHILTELQQHGCRTLNELAASSRCESREQLQTVLNILLATPLVNCDAKAGDAVRNSAVYMYRYGAPLSEPVDLKQLGSNVEKEQSYVDSAKDRITKIQETISEIKNMESSDRIKALQTIISTLDSMLTSKQSSNNMEVYQMLKTNAQEKLNQLTDVERSEAST